MGGACSTASGEVSARSDEDNLMRGHTEWCHMVSMTGMRAGCGANSPRAYRVRVVEGTYGALGPYGIHVAFLRFTFINVWAPVGLLARTPHR